MAQINRDVLTSLLIIQSAKGNFNKIFHKKLSLFPLCTYVSLLKSIASLVQNYDTIVEQGWLYIATEWDPDCHVRVDMNHAKGTVVLLVVHFLLTYKFWVLAINWTTVYLLKPNSSQMAWMVKSELKWLDPYPLLTLSVLIAVDKSEWRPWFLFLFIAHLLVFRLTRNQVQMKEN
jgi:hypothetical protein